MEGWGRGGQSSFKRILLHPPPSRQLIITKSIKIFPKKNETNYTLYTLYTIPCKHINLPTSSRRDFGRQVLKNLKIKLYRKKSLISPPILSGILGKNSEFSLGILKWSCHLFIIYLLSSAL